MEAQPTGIGAKKWRNETKADVRPKRDATYKRRQIGKALALMAAIAGAMAGMLLWLHPLPKPAAIPIWVTQYESRLIPINPQAGNDEIAMSQANFFPKRTEQGFVDQGKYLMERDLANLAARSEDEAVMIHLCAFACTADKGRVFVVPADVDPNEPNSRLSLQTVLEYVAKCPSRRKLLVLEIFKPFYSPRLGVLLNDVPSRVPDELKTVEDPDRLVLCACSPGQVALTSQVMGRSVFGYYLQSGIGGWADGYNANRVRDGRVSVKELASFLTARVDRWAMTNRATRQTPVLFGDGPDFQLFAYPHGRPFRNPLSPMGATADSSEPTSTATTATSTTATPPAASAPAATASPAPAQGAAAATKDATPAAPAATKGTASANTPAIGAAGANGSSGAGATPSAAPAASPGAAAASGAGGAATPASTAGATASPAAPATSGGAATAKSAPATADAKAPAKPAGAIAADEKSARAAIDSAVIGPQEPPSKPLEPLEYPAWLADGWRIRDQWWNDKTFRAAPRLFRQLEANLMRAENRWIGGDDQARIQADLSDQLTQLATALPLFQAVPQPQPRSLALAQTLGRTPNDALTAAAKTLLQSYADAAKGVKPEDAAKAQDKLVTDFVTKYKSASSFELSWALFQAAVEDPAPSQQTVELLASLQQTLVPQPEFVEMLYMKQLGSAAQQIAPADWPVATIHRALEVVNEQQRALSQPAPFPWVQSLLDQAVQTSHNAHMLLFARGYAPLDAVDPLMRQADANLDVINAHEDTLQQAYRTLDEGMAILPIYASYVARAQDNEPNWRSAVTATQQLFHSIENSRKQPKMTASDLRGTLQEVWRNTVLLRNALDDLTQRFGQQGLSALIQESQQPDAKPELCDEIEALLATSILRTDDRVRLWSAGMTLSLRLASNTLELDRQDDEQSQPTAPLIDFRNDQSSYQQQRQAEAALRGRLAVGVLQLGGYSDDGLKNLNGLLESAQKSAATPQRWEALELALLNTWAKAIPKQLADEKRLPEQDRLSWIFHPFDPSVILDEPSANPRSRLRAGDAVLLWTWLAQKYQYLGRDSADSAFYLAAANDYGQFDTLAPETYAQIGASFGAPTTVGGNPTVVCTLQIELYTSAGATTKVDQFRTLTADDVWLGVAADLSSLASLNEKSPSPIRATQVPLTLTLLPGATSSGVVQPKGFLVQFRVDGRTFHQTVTLPDPSPFVSELLDVFLSTDPKTGANPEGLLRLRPLPTPQEYFLYVKNRTNKPRNLIVQIDPAGGTALGGTAKLSLGPNETQPVSFGKLPLKPGVPLPDMVAPLQVQLLDVDNKNAVLDTVSLLVGIASPQEYVSVPFIQFQPPDPSVNAPNKLSLTVQATAGVTDPPVVVDLVLPPARIPGFVAVKKGALRGQLPSTGAPIQLFAQDIQLSPSAAENGYVYLSADGLARAFTFRTTFARWGDPTTPQEVDAPQIRLDAPQYAMPSDKFAVTVEVDNPPPGGKLQVALGTIRNGALVAESTQTFTPPRLEQIAFVAQGPNGGLLFQASVGDRVIQLDTTGITGLRQLQAVLLDSSGNQVAIASQAVMLDNLPPATVRFVNLPNEVLQGTPLPVQAVVLGSQSPISQVVFFLGKPVDNKLPPMAVTANGQSMPGSSAIWTAQLPLPKAPGPQDIGVQVSNKAGLNTFGSATVTLTATPPGGRIVATVIEGGRLQPNLEVVLSDPKGKEISKAKTAADGSVVFDNLAPGDYQLACLKVASQRRAAATVTVVSGKTTGSTLTLSLQAAAKQ